MMEQQQQEGLFQDILDHVILDVRQHEADLLRRNAELERENRELKEEVERMVRSMRESAYRQVAVNDKMDKVQKRMRLVKEKQKKLKEKEDKIKEINPRLAKQRIERRYSVGLLEYMVKCEELVGQPNGALEARQGLTENSSFDQVQKALRVHMDTVEKAFDQLITGYQTEIRALEERLEKVHDHEVRQESKTATAASRIREKKAMREKKELTQLVVTISNICSKMQGDPQNQGNEDIEMIAQLVNAARNRYASP